MSILENDLSPLQREFIESNNSFIKRNAELSLQEVKRPKSRDKFIEEEIRMKSDLADNFGLTRFDNDYYRNQIKMKAREMIENKNPLLSTRQIQNEGGEIKPDYIDIDGDGNKTEPMKTAAKQRDGMAEGGDIDGQMAMLMIPKEPKDDMMPEEDMLPDDEMEDEYLDFILDEALDSEEEDYLMSQLQDNERLSEIFDKVIDIAQEFAGSGPVEGPGSGVSDSIPARLSDGEFVFTAKAVEEIGADNLMAMMKDAEMKADRRQDLAEGGQPDEEETVVMPVEQPAARQDIRVTKETVGSQASQQEEDDLVGDEVKKSMLRGSRNLG